MDKYVLDRAGGPMVWVEAEALRQKDGAYVHLLPVTKLQLERFLCDQPGAQFDQRWYDAVLGTDPDKPERVSRTGRVSPYAVKEGNYFQAFATAVRPDEALKYAGWCGDDGADEYALPTDKEWFAIYTALKAAAADPNLLTALATLSLSPRMGELLDRMERVGGGFPPKDPKLGRSRAEQMLLRNGVFEWVRCKLPGRPDWGGVGKPRADVLSSGINLEDEMADFQRDALTTRLAGYGFRLLRRVGR